MPETTTTGATTAADAATAAAPTTDGATPPNAVATADKSMSLDEARQILRNAGKGPSREVDPLTDEGNGRDPLTDEGVTLEEVLGIGGGETLSEDAPIQEEPPESEATPEPPAEAVAEESTTLPEVTTEADGRKRVNIFRKVDGKFVNSELTRRALLLADEEGIDVLDALKALGAGPQLPSDKPAEAAPEPVNEPTAAEIDAQIEALKVKRKEAKAAFDDDAREEINDQINDLTRSRQDALLRDTQRQQAQRETQGTAQQQVTESMARAIAPYPDAVKAGSPLFVALQAETERLRSANSPLLNDTDWPEIVATRVATRLGIAPKVAAAPVAPVPAPPAKPAIAKSAPAAPVKRATPVPAPGSVSGATPKVDPRAELARKIDATRDPQELKELMRQAVQLERSAA